MAETSGALWVFLCMDNCNYGTIRKRFWEGDAIDLFSDTAAILISIVSNSYYGMPRGQIHVNLSP